MSFMNAIQKIIILGSYFYYSQHYFFVLRFGLLSKEYKQIVLGICGNLSKAFYYFFLKFL